MIPSMLGKMKTRVTLPDTITSWLVSAFAINRDGLAVTEKPFEVGLNQKCQHSNWLEKNVGLYRHFFLTLLGNLKFCRIVVNISLMCFIAVFCTHYYHSSLFDIYFLLSHTHIYFFHFFFLH